MGSRLLAMLLAGLLLAGCTSEAPTSEKLDTGAVPTGAIDTSAIPTTQLDPATAGAAPVWLVGDAWAITSRNGDVEEQATLVVTRVEGDRYVVATTSEQAAGWDAIFDVSYVGNIRASDLAGEQQGQPIKYFDFPLADGKSWTTTWDGLEVALTATATARGFDITGLVDGEEYVKYDFMHDLRWWSKLDFVQDGYGFTVDRAERGWTGEIASATANLVFEGAPAAPTASPNSGAFTISEGQSFALVVLFGAGSQWARAFYLVEPGGTPYMSTTIGNAEVSDAGAAGPDGYFYTEQIPATPGEWHIAAPTVFNPDGAAFVTIHEVAVAKTAFVGA